MDFINYLKTNKRIVLEMQNLVFDYVESRHSDRWLLSELEQVIKTSCKDYTVAHPNFVIPSYSEIREMAACFEEELVNGYITDEASLLKVCKIRLFNLLNNKKLVCYFWTKDKPVIATALDTDGEVYQYDLKENKEIKKDVQVNLDGLPSWKPHVVIDSDRLEDDNLV